MTGYKFVPYLEDLIQPCEYQEDPQGRRVRLRIASGPDGVRILGDAMCARNLEELLEYLGAETIAQMLCG